ncbi:prepilin-type N-terminal cleavage/methylation domain-containing protein [Lysobacter arenosi]|uniref:Prepilin-type N-terminal cleavage/methylation domain-containing protein n=1 Tax=Lysobacter arenosi TaxID=2795387 RepID=A0ABX7RAI6_9GAMM|nr:prepilin-type N-terminal cleavage/methylation domain-containing protein [Lysobacter arenosi]QSX75155.1 prepilin-type N-terminal cleavage/methylation domain-containing protein [Lysobacter arenosi]
MTARRSLRGTRGPVLASGFSLIELMISLVLGLLVVAAAGTLFMANRQTYTATESLGRLQENARVAFELMSRDVREAGGNFCGAPLASTVNVLVPGGAWYTDFSGGVRGYPGDTAFPDSAFGTGAAQRTAGTDAIELKSAFADPVTIESDNPTTGTITLNSADHGFAVGDIAVACDSNHAAIFQVTTAGAETIEHATGSGTPGNCTQGLGMPLSCDGAAGTGYQFGCVFGGVPASGVDCTQPGSKWTAVVTKIRAVRWYVATNDRGGKSLYQSVLHGSAAALETNEIVEGVNDMTLEYLRQGDAAYQGTVAAADWPSIVAMRVTLDLVGQDRVGTDGNPLQRTLAHVITIRNRLP